jgi:transposase
MPRALLAAAREEIWRRHQQGQSAAEAARCCGLNARTVRRLLGRFRLAGGPRAPDYAGCGRRRPPGYLPLHQQALALRRLHPGWGAGRILAELSLSCRREALPGRSSLKRWLAGAGLSAAPSRPRAAAPRADRVHQVWQMDACEMIPLAGGARASWLRLVDELSGAALFSRAFACPRWNDVDKLALQAALREAFVRWGRPDGLRVDHGNPWVRPGGLPSALELWLAGLGVALHPTRVRRPRDNGKVERSHGTAKRWAEPQLQASAEALQRRLDEEDRVQREVFRDDGGQTRRERYPDLWYPGRAYWAGYERYNWDWEAALACLARREVRRKVNGQGQVSLYDHHHRVGKQHAGQVAEVRFDPQEQRWRFRVGPLEAGSSPGRQVTPERLLGLALESRRGRSARQTAAKKAARPGGGHAAAPGQGREEGGGQT